MSAAYPVEASGETSEQRPREPSMEDILASIRRIIAEDQALFAADDASRAQGEAETEDHARDLAGDFSGDFSPEPPAQAVPLQTEIVDAPPLASGGTSESVAGAFNALIASRFVQNSDAILALTREALRPMLAEWLDAHLPALVERLVKAEIERMTKGA